MLRLFVRLIILTALVAALFFTPAHKTARAVSCPVCDEAEIECEASCPPLGQPGHFACVGECRTEYKDCVAFNCP